MMRLLKKNKIFIKFLIVGGLNTFFGYLIFAFFIFMKFDYVMAASLAAICGILFNFKTIGLLVFRSKNNRLIFRFFGVYIIVYLLQIFFLGLFKAHNISLLLAGALLVLPLALLSYNLMKRFIFNER